MKINVAQALIARANLAAVDIGEVRIGPAHIDRLTLTNTHLQSSTGTAELRNVVVNLTLAFGLDWRVGVTISMPDGIPDVHFSDSGTLDLGTLRLNVGLGDLTLPGLASLAIDVPTLSANGLDAIVGPLKNLQLGSVLAEQIRAQDVVAPSAGFTVAGVGLGAVSATGLELPGATIGAATVARVAGGTLPIASLSVPNVSLPGVLIPELATGNVDVTSNPVVTKMPTVDVGLLAATLKVTTTAALHLDELRLANVDVATSIGEIALTNVVLPFEVLDVSLSQVGLDTIDIPQIEVS